MVAEVSEQRQISGETITSTTYKDHFIMVVGSPANGTGFGRVMFIYKHEQQRRFSSFCGT